MRLLFSTILSLAVTAVFAGEHAEDTVDKMVSPPLQRFFLAGGMDGAIFSSAAIERTSPASPNVAQTSGRLRFSYVLNMGVTFNLNLARFAGIYSGIDIKNIGFIEKDVTSTIIKRRAYTVGAPLGIRVGNMVRKNGFYVFGGGGVDFPLNYREKSFVLRNQKTKFSEWFSERQPQFLPYAFVGASIYKSVTLKFQYYPTNFLNPEYVSGGAKPYAGYNVHLYMVSVGIVKRYSKKHDIVKGQVTQLRTL